MVWFKGLGNCRLLIKAISTPDRSKCAKIGLQTENFILSFFHPRSFHTLLSTGEGTPLPAPHPVLSTPTVWSGDAPNRPYLPDSPMCPTHTDRHTDHATCDICSNRPHLMPCIHAMRPNKYEVYYLARCFLAPLSIEKCCRLVFQRKLLPVKDDVDHSSRWSAAQWRMLACWSNTPRTPSSRPSPCTFIQTLTPLGRLSLRTPVPLLAPVHVFGSILIGQGPDLQKKS